MANTDFQNGFTAGFVAGSTNINVDMINKRDTEANWILNNPVLANGEQVIVDIDSNDTRIKVGDGVTAFLDLPYIDENIRTMLDGKADLSDDGLIRRDQLPSYVDDVIESYPVEGAEELSVGWFKDEYGSVLEPEKGKIYLNVISNKQYRWGGNTYILCNPSEVNSVNGKIGLVTLTAEDVGADAKGVGAQKASVAETNAKKYTDDKVATTVTEFNGEINKLKNRDIFETKSKSGNPIVLDDSAKAPLQNLRLFGKTTQNGTPTPEAPVDLVSVGDSGSFSVGVYGKNLLEITTTTQTINGVTFTINADKSITANGTASATTQFRFVDMPFIPKGEYIISGYPQKVGSVEYYFRATGEGWIQRVGEVSVTYTEDTSAYGMIVIGANATVNNLTFYPMLRKAEITDSTYEPCNKQTLTMPYTLRSIGNIKDEVDFNRGVLIQRVHHRVLNGSETWNVVNGTFRCSLGGYAFIIANAQQMKSTVGFVYYTVLGDGGYGLTYAYDYRIRFENVNPTTHTIEQFKEYLAENPITVIGEIATPQETPLTETELNAYRQLHTNKPNTTILSEADIEISYVVDSTSAEYIENRLNEGTPLNLYPNMEYKTNNTFNGKTVYVKMFNIGDVPRSTEKIIPHNISSIDTILDTKCMAKLEEEDIQVNMSQSIVFYGNIPVWLYTISSESIRISNGDEDGEIIGNILDCYIILYYTKI